MTQQRDGANNKAKREVLWKPQYISWRNGFALEYGQKPAPQ